MLLKSLSTLESIQKLPDKMKLEKRIEIEQALVRLLATYIVLRGKEPAGRILDDLFAIEMKAGQLLREIAPKLAKMNLYGSLAGTMTLSPPQTGKKFAPKKGKKLFELPTRKKREKRAKSKV